MKVLFVTDAPWMPTGFGRVMSNIIKYTKGVEIHVLGLPHFGTEITWNGAIIHPRGADDKGYDQLAYLVQKVRPSKVVTLTDVGNQEIYGNILNRLKISGVWKGKWYPYVPIDSMCVVDWQRTILEKADKVIAMSEYGKEMMKKLGIESIVIPHGVDNEIYKPLDSKDRDKARKDVAINDKFVVLSVGQNQIRKMWDRLIKGFAKFACNKNDVMLLMHTDQDTNHDENRGFNLNILADKYGVSEKCAFTYANTTADKLWRNKFDEKALNTIYNLADVFLMGGAEGFGIPSLECQAAGIPLIIGNQTSSIELNPNENFGRVRMDGYIEGSLGVEFGCPSVDDIASFLEAYYNLDKKERQELKDKAVEFSKKYSWEKVCEKWSELLNE